MYNATADSLTAALGHRKEATALVGRRLRRQQNSRGSRLPGVLFRNSACAHPLQEYSSQQGIPLLIPRVHAHVCGLTRICRSFVLRHDGICSLDLNEIRG